MICSIKMLRRMAADLAATFCRPEKCAAGAKAVQDALVRTWTDGYTAGRTAGLEEARRVIAPGDVPETLVAADWAGVMREVNR